MSDTKLAIAEKVFKKYNVGGQQVSYGQSWKGTRITIQHIRKGCQPVKLSDIIDVADQLGVPDNRITFVVFRDDKDDQHYEFELFFREE